MIDAVVLCGGKGTRLGALTAATPKPLLPVGGMPFLAHRLHQLKQEGCRRAILAVHYLAPRFRQFVEQYAEWLPEETCIIEEPVPLGTGGALRHAAAHVRSERFVALNGDSWGLQAVAPVVAAHEQTGRRFTMVVVRAEQVDGGARAKGLVSCSADGELLGLTTGDAASERWVNAGLYVLDRTLVMGWPDGSYDLEHRVMSLVPPGDGAVYCSDAALLDIGTPDCYERVGRVIALAATR